MNLNAFSVDLKVGTSIGDYSLPVVTGEQSPRKVMGLLGPGSYIRTYTAVYQCPNGDVRAREAEGTVVASGDRFVLIFL